MSAPSRVIQVNGLSELLLLVLIMSLSLISCRDHPPVVLSVAVTPVRVPSQSPDIATQAQTRNVITSNNINRLSEIATLRPYLGDLSQIAWSPNGRQFAVAGTRGLSLYNTQTLRPTRIITGSAASGIAFSPDGQFLVGAVRGGVIKLWEATTGRELRTFEGLPEGISRMAFGPDGSTLISGSGNRAKVWEVASGRELRSMYGHKGTIYDLALSPDGLRLAAGDGYGEVIIWDVTTGQEVNSFTPDMQPAMSLSISPDRRLLAIGMNDGTIRLFELATGRELRRLSKHLHEVQALAFSPDGKLLISGGLGVDDGVVRLWEVATGRELRHLEPHAASLYSVSFSPDQTLIAAALEDRAVKLWAVK